MTQVSDEAIEAGIAAWLINAGRGKDSDQIVSEIYLAMRSKDHSIAVDDVGLVKWHMPTMLRWLAENIDAPRLPDGTLTGRFLYAVAENIEHRTAIGSQSIEGERGWVHLPQPIEADFTEVGEAVEAAMLSEKSWPEIGEIAWCILARDREVTDWTGAIRGKFPLAKDEERHG